VLTASLMMRSTEAILKSKYRRNYRKELKIGKPFLTTANI